MSIRSSAGTRLGALIVLIALGSLSLAPLPLATSTGAAAQSCINGRCR